MNSDSPILDPGSTLSRRRFIQGIVAATVLGATGLWRRPALAVVAPDRQPELRGTEFDLELVALPVNFTGKEAVATAVNGLVPAPLLRMRESDRVTLRVTNRLNEMTSIHWHGLLVDAEMDGVPGISFPGIAP